MQRAKTSGVVKSCARASLLATAMACVAPQPAASPPPSTAFDLSTLPRFWEIHDALRRGEELADSAWNALWSSPAYALLDAKERRHPALDRAMRLAYMPSQRAAADSVMSGEVTWLRRALDHFRQVGAARDTLVKFEKTLASPNLMEQARRQAQAYLPGGTVDAHPPPPVSFLYFLDARGYPERILLDPLYFMHLRNRVEVLAHEYHHYYRSRIARPQRSYGNDVLAWLISTVESEGLAGMLDKRDVPTMPRSRLDSLYGGEASRHGYFVEYQIEFRRSSERLRHTDDVLQRIIQHPDSATILGARLSRALPDNGRIMGAFMSEVVERELGRERLAAVVGDPFAFWRLYNEAARWTNGQAHVLSDAAMVAIAAIEARYQP